MTQSENSPATLPPALQAQLSSLMAQVIQHATYIDHDPSFANSANETTCHFSTCTPGAAVVSDSSIPAVHCPTYCYLQDV